MTREKYSEIVLHLDSIHDLFTHPAEDPFSKKANFVSGIEFIKTHLKSRPLLFRARTKTIIFLPKERIEPNLASVTHDALKRYCQFRIQQNRFALVTLRRDAFQALLIGVLFLLSGLYLSSQSFLQVAFVYPFLRTLFSDGFDIAFWVILWRPVDFFLFELWPYRRESQIYKYIMGMEIVVAEEHE